MEIHLSRIAVLFATFSFTALGLSATPIAPELSDVPILTDENVKIQKQFKPNGVARLVLYNGNKVVWDTKIKNTSTISLSVEGDDRFTLTNIENNEVSPAKLKSEEYHGKMIKLDNEDSLPKTVWLVGADGKRRLIPDHETYECLKGTGLADPISVSSKILEQLPNIEDAYAICGANRMRPNEALEKGSYLQSGDYKLLLTGRDLILTKNGNQIWANNQRAAQLILQTDGNLVAYNCKYKPVWASRTEGRTPGFLFLGEDGSLRLYDGKKKQVWEP